VLSGGSARELLGAIAAGDAARFQAAPGIGKRTAQRIIVELREQVLGAQSAGDVEEIVAARAGAGSPPGARGLAREGLLELGYSAAEAEQLLGGAHGDSAEELIADALRGARAA
jgi:holliday junction DNA helicase RuvA